MLGPFIDQPFYGGAFHQHILLGFEDTLLFKGKLHISWVFIAGFQSIGHFQKWWTGLGRIMIGI
jgi:hypothetical protein